MEKKDIKSGAARRVKKATAVRDRPALDTGVRLWFLLWKAAKTQEARARRSIERMGLCLSDFGLMEALLHKGPLPVNQIGKTILITSGSMTAAVDRLEAQGLVERRCSAEDRRARIAHLTPKGSRLIARLFKEHARDMEKAFGGLDAQQKRALSGLLIKLAREHEPQASVDSSKRRNQDWKGVGS